MLGDATSTEMTEAERVGLIDQFGEDWGRFVWRWLGDMNSPRTRRTYLMAWRQFAKHVPFEHPATVTQEHVIAFKNALTEAGRSQTTVNGRLAALSSFYNKAIEAGLVEDNPVDGVKRQPVKPYGKATALDPSKGEHIQFLKAIDQSTEGGKRDFAIMLIFLTTGVRATAVTDLRMRDIRKEGSHWFMHFTDKGGKAAKAELHPPVLAALEAYWVARGDNLTDDSPVFIATERGQHVTANIPGLDGYEEQPLTYRTIYQLVKQYARRAGFDGITPHALRHTVALRLQDRASLAEISEILGHEDIRITTVYLQHVNSGKLGEITRTLADELAHLVGGADDEAEAEKQ